MCTIYLLLPVFIAKFRICTILGVMETRLLSHTQVFTNCFRVFSGHFFNLQ